MNDGNFYAVIIALALVFTGHPILGFVLAFCALIW